MKIYPKLNSLRQKLKIQKINTGKIMNYRGIVYDDMESLHAIGTIDDKVIFKSGLGMPWVQSNRQFRGQTQDFFICKANLFRGGLKEESHSSIFLQICRTIAFENLLDNHPYIKLLKTVRLSNQEIYINNTAIAQHYGLQTPYLDLTDNFDVASFFATSSYNQITKEYQPCINMTNLGVIFIYNTIANMMTSENENITFEYIGWQGFPRPEEQRASIYHLKKNKDFNDTRGVRKYYFKHSPSISKKVWKQFNKGKTLFPDDSAASLANECKKLTFFTKGELDSAVLRFKEWTGVELSEEKLLKITDELNIEIANSSVLNWGNILEIDDSYWITKFDETLKRTKSR